MNTIRLSLVSLLVLSLAGAALLAADPTPAAPAKTAPVATKDVPTATDTKYAPMTKIDDAKFNDWLARWSKNIVADAGNRYCDKDNGEDIGWRITPFLDGFYYGYLTTHDTKWLDLTCDWADSWIKRGVKEPDGYVGWPAKGAAGTKVDNLDDFRADSMLAEMMVVRPLLLTAGEIRKDPKLKEKYGAKAEGYIKLAEQLYEKWDQRGGWRETKDGGMISVTLPYGLDDKKANWLPGFDQRNAPGHGFSHPNNKANFVAHSLLAYFDVTGKPVYKERAEKWFKLLKSRLHLQADGTYKIWPYWEPAGLWDYLPDGSTKHWVGVHTKNPGYYECDAEGIVAAFQHGLVFTRTDIDHLIATSLASKGVYVWSPLVPYSAEIQKLFEERVQPDKWFGLSEAPRYLALQAALRQAGAK